MPTVSLCIPAHNEAATIGPLVAEIRHVLVRRGLLDELVVIDDRSTDDTASLARDAGATVYGSGTILRSVGESQGKGDAMWRGLAATTGDVIVWCDADLDRFDVARLRDLVDPLLEDSRLAMTKGFFRRVDDDGVATGGGRTTELVVRPMLSLLFPSAAHVREPLSGMFALRRAVAESLPFEADYGVDVGLLLDTLARCGARAVADVDLGVLSHRSQPLTSLAVQSAAVQRTILRRAGHHVLGSALIRPDAPDVNCLANVRPPLGPFLATHGRRLINDAVPAGALSR
jgi:glucosyl-3-phosphoglycerate synthase